jgi:hypothetical protein
MSIRMNIYGWSFDDFKAVLGSGDTAVLERANTLLSASVSDETYRIKGAGWLRTLIDDGYPLVKERPPVTCPDDGGLATVKMETGEHISAVYCLARAIARQEHLDLVLKSSLYSHGAIRSVDREMRASQFTRQMTNGATFAKWMSTLQHGSPLFGDQFHTYWSYYSLFSNAELAAMIPAFRDAIAYRRQFPEGYPEEMRQQFTQCLSQSSKEYLQDLIEWFGEIQDAGQDAFVLWS